MPLPSVDWAALEDCYGPAVRTPRLLAGLLSGERRAVDAGLNHLWDDLIHQGTVYSATPHAALVVASLLTAGVDSPPWEYERRPLRAKLLEWLAGLASAVGDRQEEKVWIWSGGRVALREDPVIVEIRALRPTLLDAVRPYLDDPNEPVREAATDAADLLEDAPVPLVLLDEDLWGPTPLPDPEGPFDDPPF